jgi:hypothetical protein
MNPIIEKHFDEIETYLLTSAAIAWYEIVRREIALFDGKLRIRAELTNNHTIELFEYVSEENGRLSFLKYSYHWQNSAGQLVKRWDNAPHFPDLPNAPHHIHHADGSTSSGASALDSLNVLVLIETAVKVG